METTDVLASKKERINVALAKVKKHLQNNKDDLALKILESQLSWMLDAIEKNIWNREKLQNLKLGQLAAREIETLDFSLAEDLYDLQEALDLFTAKS